MVVILARTVFDVRDFYSFQEVKPSPRLFTTLDFTWPLSKNTPKTGRAGFGFGIVTKNKRSKT